jgi:biotin synthase-related radical SAM superfamily protein
VLRHTEALTVPPRPYTPSRQRMVGVSVGTAAVLGLHRLRQAEAPTTAYLMVGERCTYNCRFCTQARDSAARAHFLSRVVWPLYPLHTVSIAVARAFVRHEIQRCCLQVTASRGSLGQTVTFVDQMRALSAIPISTSIVVSQLDEVGALLDHGVDRVTLALDAACDRTHRSAKGCGWWHRLDLLQQAAGCFPGHVGTHLIVGLGETEREMAQILQQMIDWRVSVGLFSFTPVSGTAWEDRLPPPLASYRRIQAARYLMAMEACRIEDLRFSPSGQIVSYGLSADRLWDLLCDGAAFETAGCLGCNRPYYNERPGKAMYNYPRPLKSDEAIEAITATVAALEPGVDWSEPKAAGLVADGRRR